jgi:hypothetical protein
VVIGVLLCRLHRHDIRIDGALPARDSAIRIFEQLYVAEPVRIVLFGMVEPVVVEAPAAFGAIKRGGSGHIGAIENGVHLERAHQLMRVARDEAGKILPDLGKAPLRDFIFADDLRRLQIVVYKASDLIFHLIGRQTVLVVQWHANAGTLRFDIARIVIGKSRGACERGGILASDGAIDEGAQHIIVRHACHIASSVKPRHGRACMFVDPNTRGAMTGTKADFRNMHLDHVAAVIIAATGMKETTRRALDLVQLFSTSEIVSSARWSSLRNAANSYGANYWLYLVAGCLTDSPKVQVIRDPASKLKAGVWSATPVLFSLRFAAPD